MRSTLPPPHHHNSKNNGASPVEGEERLPQELRRLTLYQQHGLHSHYSNLVNITRARGDFRDLVQHTYDYYMFGYDVEPSPLLPEQQQKAASQWPNSPNNNNAFPPFPPSKRRANVELLQRMFQKGYDSYMYNAWIDLPSSSRPSGEVAPLSCLPRDFSLVKVPALTLIDSLDTLLILGNTTEFARAVERLRHLHITSTQENNTAYSSPSLFDLDQNVSLFETNIRVLGGLLSAHQMAEAWLPEVLVLKQDVFLSHSLDRHVPTVIRNGRDDAISGVCRADEEKETFNRLPSDLTPFSSSYASSFCPASSFLPDCAAPMNSVQGGSLPLHSNTPKNATRSKVKLSPATVWSYDDFLLDLALDLGKRLLPAFDTETGIPYGTVNLKFGIPPGETTIASLAGGGTLVMEMELLSRLTKQPIFGQVAKRAARALWMRQSALYLVGKHIDVHTGVWTESLSGIGSNSDSFTEYLVKQFFLFGGGYHDLHLIEDDDGGAVDNDFWIMFVAVYTGIFLELRRGDWYVDADMQGGAHVVGRRILEALMAFYPGLQILTGEYVPAARSLNGFFLAREYLGFLPERFQFDQWKVDNGAGAGRHPLRPELLESSYLLHQSYLGTATRGSSSGWLWASDFALHKLAMLTPAPCGFASLADVRSHVTGVITGPESGGVPRNLVKQYDEMPSFFLTETIKYLYLTFDGDNKLHQDALNRNWVFTTEAHPIHMPTPNSKDVDKKEELYLLEQLLLQRVQGRDHVDAYKARSSRLSAANDQRKPQSRDYAFKTADYLHMMYRVQDLAEQAAEGNLERSVDRFFQYGDLIQLSAAMRIANSKLNGGHLLQDFDYVSINESHLEWTALGLKEGWNLLKACPNIYSTELLWMHALHGSAIDYVPRFVSVTNDMQLPPVQAQQEPVFTTSQALARYGSFVPHCNSAAVSPSDMCCHLQASDGPIMEQSPNSFNRQQDKSPSVEEDRDEPQAQEGFTEIHTEMGKFQVKAFDGGVGFSVEQIETGQVLTATFIQDHLVRDESAPAFFVMVYAVYPTVGQSGSREAVPVDTSRPVSDGSSTRRNVRLRQESSQSGIGGFDRAVIMADMHGNSFSCDVELMTVDLATNEEIDVVFQIPCTPALFGPTHFAHVVRNGGLVLEGSLIEPQGDNMFGCSHNSIANSECGAETCPNRSIFMVHRGECSFIEKSINMKSNADGVIVINSDYEDLFMMSYGAEEIRLLNGNIPVTVLISGADGSDILDVYSLLQKVNNDETYISTRISLRMQSHESSEQESLSTDKKFRFPLVRASSAGLRILSKSGWGIQAVQQVEHSQTSWHLQLMRHALD